MAQDKTCHQNSQVVLLRKTMLQLPSDRRFNVAVFYHLSDNMSSCHPCGFPANSTILGLVTRLKMMVVDFLNLVVLQNVPPNQCWTDPGTLLWRVKPVLLTLLVTDWNFRMLFLIFMSCVELIVFGLCHDGLVFLFSWRLRKLSSFAYLSVIAVHCGGRWSVRCGPRI